MTQSNHNFYSDMPINRLKLSELLLTTKAFSAVPKGWHVILTDIKGSTGAVLTGASQNVNYIATGSIVTVLNLAFKAKIVVPFFFGGDGATFLVPEVLVELAVKKLMAYQTNVMQIYGLDLRVGSIPVNSIYKEGYKIRLSKYGLTRFFAIPVILGDGLSYAENVIKDEFYQLDKAIDELEEFDLDGMQCRWDQISPPADLHEILTLLIVAPDVTQQAMSFSKVLKAIDEIYGSLNKRQPISVEKLKLNTTYNRIKSEMRHRIGKIKFFELLQTWLMNAFGPLYFLTNNGKSYLKRLVQMSDTLVMDGKINTVISGTAAQRNQLFKILDDLEKSGEIIYGFHISNASIMSCYVRDMKNDHIHFVDGAEGGYTKAAGILKGKLRDRE